MSSFQDELRELSILQKTNENEDRDYFGKRLMKLRQNTESNIRDMELERKAREKAEREARAKEEAEYIQKEADSNFEKLKSKLREAVRNNDYRFKSVSKGLFKKEKVRFISASIMLPYRVYTSHVINEATEGKVAKICSMLCELCENEEITYSHRQETGIESQGNFTFGGEEHDGFDVYYYEIEFSVEVEV